MKHTKLREYIRKEITSILSESKLNETLEEKAWAKLDRLRDAIEDDDYIIQSLMRAMSTDDANLYLDAMIRDHINIVGDAENYDNLSEWGEVDPAYQAKNKAKQLSQAKAYRAGFQGDVGLEKQFDDENLNKQALKQAKKKDSVASISNKLQKLVQDMKDKAKEYKAAEGEEKEKIKTELKKMTKEKKELEKSI
jgi:osmotically-inducible protein OsmY